ncbi:MAG: hypothetical protein IT379_15640 [Deltaproteobacteria bacterium]|nr:hypothetical protein [Deltaproteobacteria bacterium]
MTIAVLLVLLAAFAVAMFVMLARSERSGDGRTFAWMVVTDGAVAAVTAAFLVRGGQLDERGPMLVGLAGAVVLAHLTLELAWSFPLDRPRPAWLRWPSIVLSIVAFVICVHPTTTGLCLPFVTPLYFVPYFVTTVALMVRNARAVRGTPAAGGVWLVIGALTFRWVVGIGVYLVAQRFGREVFVAGLHFERSGAMLLGWLLFGYAILRFRLFRIRGVLVELVVYAGLAVSVLGLVVLGIELVLDRVRDPVATRALLGGLALVPTAAVLAGRRLLPALEERVLGPLDPRREVGRGLLARVVAEVEAAKDPIDVLVLARDAVGEMTCGGSARFFAGPAYVHPRTERTSLPGGIALAPPDPLPAALGEPLLSSDSAYLHRAHAGLDAEVRAALDALDTELLVPLRRGRALFGALAVTGGTVDRETATLAVAVAGHLAVKLENVALAQQAVEMRVELDESRRLAELGAFAAAIAHDIRTPLTSIQMNVQILKSKVALPPDDMEHFDIALEELARLNASVSELLDFAKPVALARRPVDARELVDGAARGLAPILDERHVSIERRHDDGVPPVLADPQRMKQVLVNLLDNAAQASDDGAAIVLASRREGPGRVALEVIDRGRGISEDAMPRIFEPFYTTRADGTGLGLAIAQKLVRAHGGEIRVASTPGEGTRFTVVLPAA